MGSRTKPFFACGLLQFLICAVRDIGSAGGDRIDAVGVDVNPRNIESSLTERQRERQADVAQADDAEAGRFGFDAVFKLEISVAFDIHISLNDCSHYECSSISSLFPSSQRRGGAKRRGARFGEAFGRSDHPVCASLRSAHPPLLCEEGNSSSFHSHALS